VLLRANPTNNRDDINVAYIIQLLIKLKSKTQTDTSKAEQEIMNLLSTETTLRSKRELIEIFIKENLPDITDTAEIQQEFDNYWSE
jgi:type I restriction enzyme R subunit